MNRMFGWLDFHIIGLWFKDAKSLTLSNQIAIFRAKVCPVVSLNFEHWLQSNPDSLAYRFAKLPSYYSLHGKITNQGSGLTDVTTKASPGLAVSVGQNLLMALDLLPMESKMAA